MAKQQEKKQVVVPMNLLSVESMMTQLKTVSPATLEVFKSFENLDSAHSDSEIKTIALLEEYTADGILSEEIVETFETRMKELEAENNRLKKMYAEVQIQKDVLKEAMAKKW